MNLGTWHQGIPARYIYDEEGRGVGEVWADMLPDTKEGIELLEARQRLVASAPALLTELKKLGFHSLSQTARDLISYIEKGVLPPATRYQIWVDKTSGEKFLVDVREDGQAQRTTHVLPLSVYKDFLHGQGSQHTLPFDTYSVQWLNARHDQQQVIVLPFCLECNDLHSVVSGESYNRTKPCGKYSFLPEPVFDWLEERNYLNVS